MEYKYENFTNANVKFLREQSKIPQAKLAKNLKIDQSTLAKWENNTRQITLEWAIKIAEYFNIFVGDFITKDLESLANEAKIKSKNNDDDAKIKQLETETGIKISYSSDKPLTQEDYMAINEAFLKEMKEQNKD